MGDSADERGGTEGGKRACERLGDAMDEGFTDIGDQWAEAQDAINRLAAKDIISSGGAFRPGVEITRAEMATFLVGLLAEAAPNVTIDSSGTILLGTGSERAAADDWFRDARASLPRANDAEVSALYELGVTKGASAAADAVEGKAPLDYNYDPDGTVDRGEMAAFITRALGHTSARPVGVSAQWDDGEVVVSVRDDDFRPTPAVVVDIFSIGTDDAGAAFKSDGSCAETEMVGGTYLCEIDNTDEETGNDGDVKAALDVDADTTVWVWTGAVKDTFDRDDLDDTEWFRLDIPKEAAAAEMADRVHVATEFTGDKVRLGSSVVYTVQLQSAADKATTVGADGEKPASFLVTLSTIALADTTADGTVNPTRVATGFLSVETKRITTGPEGNVDFTVSAPADPDTDAKQDKFQVDVTIRPAPDGNAPADTVFYIGDSDSAATPANGVVTVISGATTQAEGLTFSTEASTRATTGTVTVKSAADYVAASARGASNSVTVTVTDQYGDPVSGAEVTLSSTITAGITLDRATRRTLSDGSRTWRYERAASGAAAETLTATWDPDGPDGDAAAITGTDAVEWAAAAPGSGTGVAIAEFDTDTNTIFAGGTGSVVVMSYDSNDRFNVGADGAETASSYAAFEKALAKGLNLGWTITGSTTRAVNTFTLATS